MISTHLVEALALQAAPGDSEVDKGHPRTEVRGELNLGGAVGKWNEHTCMPYPLDPATPPVVPALTEGSLVERKMVKAGERSMSWSPRVIRTRPPVLRTSRFSTGLRIGS